MNINKYKSYWGAQILPQRLDKILEVKETKSTILDYGCGQGAYTRYLNEKNIKTIGVDIINYKEWFDDSNFLLIEKDLIPFRDNHFDVCFCFEVLEHCHNIDKVIKDILRVTKKHFILSVPNCDINNSLRVANLVPAHWTDQTHINFFTKASLLQTLEKYNFNIKTVEDCLPISVSEYFWQTLKVPSLIKKIGAKLCRDFHLSPIFYSSILVHCTLK